MRHHQAGRAAEAERSYRAVLKAERKHAGALHGLGVLCSQQGRYDEAVRLLRQAIKAAPNSADAYNDLGTALHGQRRSGEAIAWYERAVALKPDLAPAHYNLANAFAALGRHGDALASYERAVALKPDYAEAYHNLGVALAMLGRHDDAVAQYERALKANPAIIEAHYNLANSLAALKRHDDAIRHYEAAVALNPDYVAAYNNLGTALAALGRYDDAVGRFERALAVYPDHVEAHNNLGSVLHALGQYEKAIGHFRQALALRADYAEAHFNLGNALTALGRLDEGLAAYDAAVAAKPDYVEAYYNRGNVLKQLDRNAEAAASYESAIAIRPDYMEAYNNLGNALLDQRRYEEAIARFETALELNPASAEAHNNLGSTLQALGRHAEAMVHYETALTLKPGYADAFTNIGNALMEMGRLDEARRAFETAIELQPRRAKFYRNLIDSKRFSSGDPHLAAMRDLAQDAAALPVSEQIDLHFALGKALADAGDHAASFRHLIEGNALKRRSVAYNEGAVLEFFAGLPNVFTRELLQAKRAAGHPSTAPVFIVGMPRSGTTLIEQILASHPQVFGAGELGTFSELMVATQGLDAALAHVEPTEADRVLRELGTRYVESVRALAPAAARITDKMPVNFRLLGLIHLALPNARIIHARRDPVDTCLSCFARAFTGDQPFSYDLAELGRYYRGYHAVMAHWRSVLPAETLLEVDYESVVDDLEGQARRIVAHCGLDWAESCLEFYRTERVVRTASATQVRQPIYKTSVGRWRVYGAMLRPLFDALGPELTGDRRVDERGATPNGRRVDTAQAFAAAVQLHRQDKLVEAVEAYSAILANEPNHFGALYALGALRTREGRLDEAVGLIGAAVRADNTCAEAHHDLGRVLFALKRYDEALAHYEAALAIKPDYADALGGYGAALQALNRPHEAIAPYEKALVLKPAAHLHNNLGNALVAAKRLDEAVAQYDRALALNPDLAEAHGNRGVALQALGRFAEAAEAHQRALALRPAYFDAHYNLGTVLWALDRHEAAVASYERALALNPSCAEGYGSLGKLLMELGRVDDAVRAFERAIEAAPSRPAFYRNLVEARRIGREDPRLAAMEHLADGIGALPAIEQTELHFALGKAYADVGEPRRSFRHLAAGNSLKRRQIVYDEQAALDALDRTKAVFTPALMSAKQGCGDPSPVPIFVVGMWRSGTTLIEQLLSASPRVHGAGELTHIAQAAAGLGSGPAQRAFPEAVADMTSEQLRALGAAYVERLRAAAPGADVVVDKMPANFRFVGLIHLALPNARIIHARRDPLDTCVSCFSRLFTQEQPYIYDLRELGRYYRAYHALMAHWRRVMPAGVMLDVDYEDLVAHTEEQGRRIFAHCRLAWEPSHLEFHKVVRPVRSASAVQVRQPIYGSSVGRWQVYGELLAPLIEALGPELARSAAALIRR
jgi:tetratricopeptide (TPR) repeat protein